MQQSGSIISVLLIEQNPDYTSPISRFFSTIKECVFDHCLSYHQALERISASQPDLVLLAHGLPGGDGFALFTELRVRNPSVALIASLSESDRKLVSAYKNGGAFECLCKGENYLPNLFFAVKNLLIRIIEHRSAGRASFTEVEEGTTYDSSSPLLESSLESLEPNTLQPNQHILHYRVVAEIGQGGMGQVYKAEDLKLGRNVAIKVLPLSATKNRNAKRRLIREARAASALIHENVVTIHSIEEFGEFDFIVMEYVEGESLRKVLERKPMDLGELLEIGAQIADALQMAHPIGLIHRDIKPANIMLTKKGHVKLLDFGLAKKSWSGEIEKDRSADLTAAGSVVGTVSYMSPEQTRGEELDGRSDIFSLGIVLYQAATGKLPFDGRSYLSIMHKIGTVEPPSPSSLRPDLPKQFDEIIERALAKDKEQRFQSAGELGVALRKLQSAIQGTIKSTDITILGMDTQQSLPKMRQSGLKRTIDSIAVLPFINQGSDPDTEYLSHGITENLLNTLSQLPNLRVVPRSTVFRYKDMEVDPQKVGVDLDVRAVLTGRVVYRSRNLNVQTELIDVARNSQIWGEQFNRKFSDIFLIQEEIANEIAEKLQVRLSGKDKKRLTKRYTENTAAYQSYLKGRYYLSKRTEESVNTASGYFERAVGEDPGYALAYAGLADSYNLRGSYGYQPPRETFPAAKAAALRALEIDSKLGEAHASLGYTLLFRWEWTDAENEFLRALKLNPNYSTSHLWYGLFLNVVGRFDESLTVLTTALQLDPLSLVVNLNLGMLFLSLRQYDQAIEQLLATIEMEPAYAPAHLFLGLAYQAKGSHHEAIAELEKAAANSKEVRYLAALAHAYSLGKKQKKALEILQSLNALSERRYVSPIDMAIAHLGMGEIEAVFGWLDKAYYDFSSWMIFLKVDPRFDLIRSEPRFVDCLRRMDL